MIKQPSWMVFPRLRESDRCVPYSQQTSESPVYCVRVQTRVLLIMWLGHLTAPWWLSHWWLSHPPSVYTRTAMYESESIRASPSWCPQPTTILLIYVVPSSSSGVLIVLPSKVLQLLLLIAAVFYLYGYVRYIICTCFGARSLFLNYSNSSMRP